MTAAQNELARAATALINTYVGDYPEPQLKEICDMAQALDAVKAEGVTDDMAPIDRIAAAKELARLAQGMLMDCDARRAAKAVQDAIRLIEQAAMRVERSPWAEDRRDRMTVAGLQLVREYPERIMGWAYAGEATGYVVARHRGTVDALNPRHDLAQHSLTGFSWGYGGSGPLQLSLAICADLLGDDARALATYKRFCEIEVSQWEKCKAFVLNAEAAWEVITIIEEERAEA